MTLLSSRGAAIADALCAEGFSHPAAAKIALFQSKEIHSLLPFALPEKMVAMPNQPGRFNAAALYAALDAQRRERGMSWAEVSAEIGVSASTLTRTRLGGRMEVDGMLAMVRWLGRTAESFTFGYKEPD